jgi:hypothetical protein
MAVAKGLSFYANGVNLAGAFTQFDAQAEREELDATVLSNTSRAYQLAFKSGMLSASGLFVYDQTNADEIHNIMSAAFAAGSSVICDASLETLAIGGVAILLDGIVTSYGIETPLGQLITVSANLRSTTGLNFGKWHFNSAVNNTTSNGTSIDNSASSSNGGIFHVQVQNPSGLAGSCKIQHSTDGSTWADLGTVTLTAALLEALSLEIAAGTTVNRYTRAQPTATGGSITFQAAFARR